MTGKLPVKADMNWIPEFQQDTLGEMPPPIPPKMMDQGENDDAHALESNFYHHKMMPTCDSDTLAPVLPPKPR